MSDAVTREEFDALKERVSELESQLDTSPRVENGLDHRDQTVLERIRENGDPGPLGTVTLYQTHTDISNRRTAKRRAETLRSRQDYEELIA